MPEADHFASGIYSFRAESFYAVRKFALQNQKRASDVSRKVGYFQRKTALYSLVCIDILKMKS